MFLRIFANDLLTKEPGLLKFYQIEYVIYRYHITSIRYYNLGNRLW